MSDGEIAVSVTADVGYLPHVATMLASAVAVPHQPPLAVHLLHGGDLDDVALAPLRRRLDAAGGTLRAHVVDPERLEGISDAKFSRTAWYRVLLPELVADAHRVVHLDGDALVLDSLAPLACAELGGKPFAAVENALYPWMPPAWSRLGLPEGTAYPNSGVMVMDLEALRAADAVDRLLDHGRRHPESTWPEQDALAVVFAGRWQHLDPRWNVQTSVVELPPRMLPWPGSVIAAARREPAIRHFSGPLKPWEGWGTVKSIERYVRYRSESGYPLADRPHRPLVARVAPRLPLRLRKQLLFRVLRRRQNEARR